MRKLALPLLLLVACQAADMPPPPPPPPPAHLNGAGVPPLLVLDSTLQGKASTASPLGVAPTAVTPGSYTSTNLTVDADGRITAAANGTGGITGSGTSGDLTAWNGTSSVTNYAGSSPSACTTGKAITGIAISAAGVITPTCTTIGGGTIATTSNVLNGDNAGNAVASSITDNGTTVATSEAVSLTGGATVTGGTTTDALSVGVIAPTAITGTVNDFNCSGAAACATAGLIQVGTSGNATINGIVAPTISVQGHDMCVQNVGPTGILTIAHQAAGSTAANRFVIPGGNPYVIPVAAVGQTICFFYDNTLDRWQMQGTLTFPALNVGGASGSAVTITNAGLINATRLTLGGTTAVSPTANVGFSFTAQAASIDSIDVTNTATFNTTAAVRTAGGINVSVTATRSSGANNLNNIASTFTATGGQTNTAINTVDGNNLFNSSSGSSTFQGAVTINNTETVTGLATLQGGGDSTDGLVCTAPPGTIPFQASDTNTAYTASTDTAQISAAASFDTTSGSLTNRSLLVTNTSNLVAGSLPNTLTAIALDVSALPAVGGGSGTEVSDAIRTTDGNNDFNTISGSTTFERALTVVSDLIVQTGHIRSTGTRLTTSNLSSCGTSPAIVSTSTDTQGTITVGAASTTSCTLTFNGTFTTTPTCVCSSNAVSTGGVFTGCKATSATTMVATLAGGTAAEAFSYICVGN